MDSNPTDDAQNLQPEAMASGSVREKRRKRAHSSSSSSSASSSSSSTTSSSSSSDSSRKGKKSRRRRRRRRRTKRHGERRVNELVKEGFKTVPPESLISQNARDALTKFLEHREFGRTEIGAEHEGGVGTVGAVAIDSTGSIAVATSTGGMSGKAVGRIGDTPQIGSGTYADDAIGGVSTTGHGESILKYCLAHSIVKLMEGGLDAGTATKTAVNGMTKRLNNTAGAITLSKSGQVGVHFSSKRMSWAYIRDGKYYYGIEQGEVLSEKFE